MAEGERIAVVHKEDKVGLNFFFDEIRAYSRQRFFKEISASDTAEDKAKKTEEGERAYQLHLDRLHQVYALNSGLINTPELDGNKPPAPIDTQKNDIGGAHTLEFRHLDGRTYKFPVRLSVNSYSVGGMSTSDFHLDLAANEQPCFVKSGREPIDLESIDPPLDVYADLLEVCHLICSERREKTIQFTPASNVGEYGLTRMPIPRVTPDPAVIWLDRNYQGSPNDKPSIVKLETQAELVRRIANFPQTTKSAITAIERVTSGNIKITQNLKDLLR